MTCLHGKTPGIWIILAPTVDFRSWNHNNETAITFINHTGTCFSIYGIFLRVQGQNFHIWHLLTMVFLERKMYHTYLPRYLRCTFVIVTHSQVGVVSFRFLASGSKLHLRSCGLVWFCLLQRFRYPDKLEIMEIY